jgi:hypothetical protein
LPTSATASTLIKYIFNAIQIILKFVRRE